MSTSSRAWRTMERTCGSVASLPARSAAAWTSLAAPITSATWCRTASARSVPARQAVLEPQQPIELPGHRAQRAAHRRQLGHRGVVGLGVGDGDLGILDRDPHAAAHPGRRAAAELARAWPAPRSAPGRPPGRRTWPGRHGSPRGPGPAASAGARSCAPPRRRRPSASAATSPAISRNSTHVDHERHPLDPTRRIPERAAVPLADGARGTGGRRRGASPARPGVAARDPLAPRAPAQPGLRRRLADRRLLPGAPPRGHRHHGPHRRRRVLGGLDPPAGRPPAHGRPRRRRRAPRLRRRRRQLDAAGRQRVRAQGPGRLLHRALRRRVHRHPLHPRPPRALLRGPLPLRRERPRQGVRLRPAARAAGRAPHVPCPLGGVGHRPRRRGVVPPDPGRRRCPRGRSSPSRPSSPPASSAASSPSPRSTAGGCSSRRRPWTRG